MLHCKERLSCYVIDQLCQFSQHCSAQQQPEGEEELSCVEIS